MKKLIFNVCGAAIVAAALMFNLQNAQSSADSTTLSTSLIEPVQIEAIAGSDFDPIEACNTYCWHTGYVCVLLLSNGAQLNCWGWDEPF
ncbi:MAG: hypothetical protein ACFHWX_18205 [Bacteroidota bacterium]